MRKASHRPAIALEKMIKMIGDPMSPKSKEHIEKELQELNITKPADKGLYYALQTVNELIRANKIPANQEVVPEWHEIDSQIAYYFFTQKAIHLEKVEQELSVVKQQFQSSPEESLALVQLEKNIQECRKLK